MKQMIVCAALMAAIVLNAEKDDAYTFIHATDLHSSETAVGALKMPNKFEGVNFVDDVNALNPSPAFALFTGDLISETTRDPATWPRAERYWARYRWLITDRLRIPFWQILGNNDCAAEPYLKVYPGMPLYWSFSRGGVSFAGLHGYSLWKKENSNHAGILFDRAQLEWLDKIVSESKDRTLVIVTHEPLWEADTHRARRQLIPILAKFGGEKIWNIAGHGHSNQVVSFALGAREVTGVETTTPVGVWKPSEGAYRIFEVADGRIASSALRWLTKDGAPLSFAAKETMTPAKRERLIEERLADGAIRTIMVGEEDLPLRRDFTAVQDRLSGLRFYAKGASAVYCVPTEGASRLRLAVNIEDPTALSISKDGKAWLAASVKRVSGFTETEIPTGWEEVYFRITRLPYAAAFYGFAMLK